MKQININRKNQRLIRHKRILKRLKNNAENKPVLVVTKTNAHIIAQLIDINKQITLVSSSSIQLKLNNGNIENAKKVGTDIGTKIKKLGISSICFDRGGSKYHGRIEALANAVREVGVEF